MNSRGRHGGAEPLRAVATCERYKGEAMLPDTLLPGVSGTRQDDQGPFFCGVAVPEQPGPQKPHRRLPAPSVIRRLPRQQYLGAAERRKLAGRMRLSEVQIKTWFQNRRMKLKRQLQELRSEPFCSPPLPYGPQSGVVPLSLTYVARPPPLPQQGAASGGFTLAALPAPTLDISSACRAHPVGFWAAPYFVGEGHHDSTPGALLTPFKRKSNSAIRSQTQQYRGCGPLHGNRRGPGLPTALLEPSKPGPNGEEEGAGRLVVKKREMKGLRRRAGEPNAPTRGGDLLRWEQALCGDRGSPHTLLGDRSTPYRDLQMSRGELSPGAELA
ncbi:PREDICTED: NK1 transcription factor-related protein 2-like [Chaetura pelagica]|uniref:NK1 transcription factor-related protein 2-like n=1 Tax=Chaetura pelagica TaxID=8897 RepID=UPI0005239825|nr:PREDICTED: NK1 transcription factor-related protein 2-like [Chaetura pelagica]